jgi:hypothetical protein
MHVARYNIPLTFLFDCTVYTFDGLFCYALVRQEARYGFIHVIATNKFKQMLKFKIIHIM